MKVWRIGLCVLTLAPASAGLGSGCLDRPDVEELVAQPVIVTKRDQNADFASFTTFAMTESITVESALDASATAPGPAEVANPTLDEISAQLVSRGYRRVARTEGPDLGVAVTAVSRLNAVVVNYGAWWGAGPASGGYWGYPGAIGSTIGYSSVVAWQSGTLIIELYDLRAARAAATTAVPIPAIWAALAHGVLGGAGTTLTAPPIDAIRQAFAQSPYLARPTEPITPLEVP
jgi:hypothetical protein